MRNLDLDKARMEDMLDEISPMVEVANGQDENKVLCMEKTT